MGVTFATHWSWSFFHEWSHFCEQNTLQPTLHWAWLPLDRSLSFCILSSSTKNAGDAIFTAQFVRKIMEPQRMSPDRWQRRGYWAPRWDVTNHEIKNEMKSCFMSLYSSPILRWHFRITLMIRWLVTGSTIPPFHWRITTNRPRMELHSLGCQP